MTVVVHFLHPHVTIDHIGMIPLWLDERDERPAAAQLDAHYAHGGGWRPLAQARFGKNDCMLYPGDPAQPPLALMHLRDERIYVYNYGFVGIVQRDGTAEFSRMD